jgi:hypothetical protein
MAYPPGFTYVSGPEPVIREFNLTSTATVRRNNPVMISGAGTIIESLATAQTLAGFIVHNAVDSLPAGKCLVAVPQSGTIFASIITGGVAASGLSSGATLGHAKTGNDFYVTGSPTTAIYVVVPRGDGSTINSTDSSIWVQVIGQQVRPFELQAPTQTL